MKQEQLEEIVKKQKDFFQKGKTLSVSFRIKHLKKLYSVIQRRELNIADALHTDLGKSSSESYMTETGMALSELSYQIKHIRKFAGKKSVVAPLAQFPSSAYTLPAPYGTVLVISPWNYPFLLAIQPLCEAVAAGNTVVFKPSSYAPATANVVETILKEVFPEEYVAVVQGGREENQALLQLKFDYIFFTGSKAVGKEVYRAAAENMTPVTLELGGKSPCIVDPSANVPLAAKRIVFGKFLNLGQTCVAPDYILCHKSVHDQLIIYLKKEIEAQFGKDPLLNLDYGKMINKKHYERVKALIDPTKVVHGGQTDDKALRIAPTILDKVSFDDPVMAQEIFGPVLPVISFQKWDEVTSYVNSHDLPLAMYYFSRNDVNISRAQKTLFFGGGCINDTIVHLSLHNLPFGGVGASGVGSYHGQYGFNTFSHTKGIVRKSDLIDLPMRYQPYTVDKDSKIKKHLK